jgi:hypothetical protein
MIEHAIRSLLANNEELTAIVGDRIYYVTAPEKVATPYLVLSKVSALRDHVHSGPAGLASVRMQVSIIADTYLGTKEIATLIQTTLQGFRGQSESMDIDGIFYMNEVDIYDGIYILAVDYQVLHKE